MRRALPLLLAIAAFFIAALIWIGSNRVAGDAFRAGSALNTSTTGTSLAYAYFRRLGQGNLLTTPLRSGAVPGNAVVFRVDASYVVDVDDDDESGDKKTKTVPFFLAPADEEFVRSGGRLVIAGHHFKGAIEMRFDVGKVASKVFPIWPGVDTLSLPAPFGLAPRSLPRGMHTIFAGNGEAVVARQTIGAGDVIIVSEAKMFENLHLAADHHLALLLSLAANHRPVYFDEYAHGVASDDGALALMTEWRLGPLLILLGIAALFTFWRNARRVGLPDAEERDTRSDAIDLVASLGALYGRSMSNSDAIALYRSALERTVAAQSGLRGDALHKRVADLTHGLVPGADEKHAFDRQLNVINDAFRTLERTARGGQHANHR